MTMGQDDAIAIVGYGGIFPGAGDHEQFWTNIIQGVDATSEVPPGRWLLPASQALDPSRPRLDKVYTTRGGFVDALEVDPEGLDIDPALLRRLDSVLHLALHVGRLAWNSARTESLDRRRVGVIFGNIVLPTERSSSFSTETLGRFVEEGLAISPDPSGQTDPLNAFPAALPATLLARALGLSGPAFTLDAACASSLYALKLAVGELRSGRAEAMLTGGLARPDPLYTQMGFSQLQALSARGKPAPFDVNGDGLIVGEGAGFFVLKRLGDALRQGDTIHALIRGIGLSNDVGGDLLAPSSEGQLRAMRAAYQQAGWSPQDVDLIECHATGTPVGDAVEVQSLKTLWQTTDETPLPGRCVIGSVKSNVGHMLTAAGAAGLLKILLALKHQVLPPTANLTRVSPRLELEGSPFRILQQPEPWHRRAPGSPRRAALSGFGFGGINAHVLIEEWVEADVALPLRSANREASPIAIVGMAAHFGPFTRLRAFQERVLGGDDLTGASAPRRSWSLRNDLNEGAGKQPGFYLDDFALPLGKFRIPPLELRAILPQQSLMLKVAAEAIEDSRWTQEQGHRTGVLIGLGLDQHTNNFQLRWWVALKADEWNRTLKLNLSGAELDHWVNELQNAVSPPLTANRTMGSLGGLVASRIAREYRIGGPSFSVSCDEASGTQALQIALGWLQRGELDAVLVGAVDIAGDLRTVLAANQVSAASVPGEGAAALVLKRLDDARRDGDRVYATLRDALATTGRTIEDEELDGAAEAMNLGSTAQAIGRVGAATGLASVVKSALGLYQEILPPAVDSPARLGPQFWLRNRAEGPRRALVQVKGLGGTEHRLLLEAVESTEHPGAFREIERTQPLGARGLALFGLEAEDQSGLNDRAGELLRLAQDHPDDRIELLARLWWERRRPEPSLRAGLAVIADSVRSLERALDAIRRSCLQRRVIQPGAVEGSGAWVIPPRLPFDSPPRIAFVYPGLGNMFAGMGRSLSALFPEVLREQDAGNGRLRDQFRPDLFWNAERLPHFEDHRPPILGQVALGSLTTEIVERLGVTPDAAIGYSMGESTALVSLHAWTDRDEMTRRLVSSPLFAQELAGRCLAARQGWNLRAGDVVDWVAGVVPRSSRDVADAIKGHPRVYILIRNLASETVIGGQRQALQAVIEQLGGAFHELPAVSTVHCEIGRAVEAEYRALHDLPTASPSGVVFYNGVLARAYQADRELAADAITAQASQPFDFPAVVERAYADGIRVFLEMGPGGSCTRLIDRILAERAFLACSVCLPDRDPLLTLLEAVGSLIAARIPVNLEPLYGRSTRAIGHQESGESTQTPDRMIIIELGPKPLQLPGRPARVVKQPPSSTMPMPEISPLTSQLQSTAQAHASAHEAFLRVARGFEDLLGRNIQFQLGLIDASGSEPVAPPSVQILPQARSVAREVALERHQCLEFAIGSIATVLGPEYASIDNHPTRVRLPDEPLMLVDRIVTIEGQALSRKPGRVVTEHDILEDAWYLDAGRIPPCIAIESGQADLFLSGYLGIDFVTRGLAVYRLLDATVTFHRPLPCAWAVIRYDIKITQFFRQGDTHLFRFEFDGTVDGEPLLSMRDGCAGFFSAEELEAGKGIVPRPLDARPRPGIKPADWTDLVPVSSMSLDDRQVDALRRGDLAAAFGTVFSGLDLNDPLPLPGGRMTLVHRVKTLDPRGGRFGLGLIRAEADIHPEDWFMVCHFVDDRVMPGTLMYECCLHTLRIFLMRLGWVGDRREVVFEPLPGVANRLRCRGQVIESTQKVTYEVSIKEVGYVPEPYAIADALMFADGKPIVEITDMALRLSGTSRERLERLWRKVQPVAGQVFHDQSRILAFAAGKPSEGFGERYRPFDEGRFIARLPAPPYQFLDRVMSVEGEPWRMVAGTSARAEYDIPHDAWYFQADRQDRVPYAVLLEAALQPCGWLAAYMGSALTSDEPLKFRNLGGTACQHAAIDRRSGTLSTRVQATKITKSAGMIIQHYDFTVHCRESLIFDGSTYFGFFHPDALAEQVGIREAAPYRLSPAEQAAAESFPIPNRVPFPDNRWRMLERVTAFVADGGPRGLGVIEGASRVDPSAWFFQAHFLGDPVWPGSLGLESVLQLLKVVAEMRWGTGGAATFDSPGLAEPQRWVYRGQIVPSCREVTAQAVMTGRDDKRRWLKADGHLMVDGKIIYQLKDFTLRLVDH